MTDWLKSNWAFILIFLLVAGYVNQWTAAKNEKEISRLELQAADFENKKKELADTITRLSTEQAELETQIVERTSQIIQAQGVIAQNLLDIDRLEREREDNQLSTRMIKTDDKMIKEFRNRFPAFAAARDFGLIDIHNEEYGVKLKYLALPAKSAKTFIIQHDAMGKLEEQITGYKENEATYGEIVTLYDENQGLLRKVNKLEQEKAHNYRVGFEQAGKLYGECKDDRIADLRKPRFDSNVKCRL